MNASLHDELLDLAATFDGRWDRFGCVERCLPATTDPIEAARALLAKNPGEPEVKGLLALFLFLDARRGARLSAEGAYVPLDTQDIGLWRWESIEEAEGLLRSAFTAGRIGGFQLEAAIQSAYVARKRRGVDVRKDVERLYEALVACSPTLRSRVGRCGALMESQGAERALGAISKIDRRQASEYQPYWAVLAEIHRRLWSGDEATKAYDVALELCDDAAVRSFLIARRSSVE